MSDQRSPLREVAWVELFPWLILVRSLKIALGSRAIVVAAAGVLSTVVGWWALGKVFWLANDPWLTPDRRAAYASCPWTSADAAITSPLGPLSAAPSADPELGRYPDLGRYSVQPFLTAWIQLSAPGQHLFDDRLTWLGLVFVLLALAWVVVIWSFFGTILTRMAAMQFCREERVELRAAARYALRRCSAGCGATWLPLAAVAVFASPLVVLGWILRLGGTGVFLGSLAWPLALLLGLLLAVILLGLSVGWPLMVASIGVDAADGFEAVSRCYSYVFQRPLHYLFYAALAVALGLVGGWFVLFFGEAVLYLGDWAVGWGAGRDWLATIGRHDAEALGLLGGWGASVRDGFRGLVRLAQLGFVYAYFWTAVTGIYLLLRYQTDGVELDELHLDDAADPHGLPTLDTDPHGVPVVPGASGPAPASGPGAATPPAGSDAPPAAG